MKVASKKRVRDFLADDAKLGKPHRKIMQALAGQKDPTSLSVLTSEITPHICEGTMTNHVHTLRKKLAGTGFKVERVTGYRLMVADTVIKETAA